MIDGFRDAGSLRSCREMLAFLTDRQEAGNQTGAGWDAMDEWPESAVDPVEIGATVEVDAVALARTLGFWAAESSAEAA